MLNNLKVAKLLDYKKKIITIFAKVKQLVYRFQSTVIKQKIIWESIISIVALNLTYNNFEITILPIFYSCDKNFEAIKQIVISIKVKKLAKHIIKATINLVIMAKKNNQINSMLLSQRQIKNLLIIERKTTMQKAAII